MPEVIDWRSVPDPDAAVRSVVSALQAGRIVLLPTEAGYVLAANGQSVEACAKLRQLLQERDDSCSMALSGEFVRACGCRCSGRLAVVLFAACGLVP